MVWWYKYVAKRLKHLVHWSKLRISHLINFAFHNYGDSLET